MIDDLIKKIVTDEINKMTLKDKMTGYLVKKKKRGAFQALQECGAVELEVRESTATYIMEWFKNELLNNKDLQKKFSNEIRGQVYLELSSKGFGEIK